MFRPVVERFRADSLVVRDPRSHLRVHLARTRFEHPAAEARVDEDGRTDLDDGGQLQIVDATSDREKGSGRRVAQDEDIGVRFPGEHLQDNVTGAPEVAQSQTILAVHQHAHDDHLP